MNFTERLLVLSVVAVDVHCIDMFNLGGECQTLQKSWIMDREVTAVAANDNTPIGWLALSFGSDTKALAWIPLNS